MSDVHNEEDTTQLQVVQDGAYNRMAVSIVVDDQDIPIVEMVFPQGTPEDDQMKLAKIFSTGLANRLREDWEAANG
jgi:hypothetical protein